MSNIIVNIRKSPLPNRNDAKQDKSITKEGFNLAVEEGRELDVPKGGIFAYSSPLNCTKETAKAVLFGVYQTNYKNRKIAFADDIQIANELDSMAGYIKIPNIKKVFSSMPLDDAVNLVIKEYPESMQRAGKEITYFILKYAKLHSDNYSNEHPILIKGISHGPKVDAGLLYLMNEAIHESSIVSTRKIELPFPKDKLWPIKDVKEIGGALKEAEYFSVHIKYKKGIEIEKISFRRQDYIIDNPIEYMGNIERSLSKVDKLFAMEKKLQNA